MSEFWKKLLLSRPDLVGTSVFFGPNTKSSLECIIREDGTVSPIYAPSLRFDSACKLAAAVKSGDLGAHCTFKIAATTKPSKYTFDNDFFLECGRRRRVRDMVKDDTRRHEQQSECGNVGLGSSTALLGSGLPDESSRSTSISAALSGTAYDEQVERCDLTPSFWARLSNYVSKSELGGPSKAAPVAATVTSIPRQCPGFERAKLDDVLKQRSWTEDSANGSPFQISGEWVRSRKCTLELRPEQSLCFECRKGKALLYRIKHRYKKQPLHANRRLLHCPNRWLSAEEQKHKMALLLRTKQEKVNILRKEAAKRRRCEKELAKYKPIHRENRTAVKEITRRLEKESDLNANPTCLWNDGHGPCGVKMDTPTLLREHVRKEHLDSQRKRNTSTNDDANNFACKWGQCKRKPMKLYAVLRRHMITHIGSINTEEKVAMLRESMVNASRPPTGRRYSIETKLRILAQYRSRGMWKRTRATCPLPLPSLGCVLKWKNVGVVDSGVDEEVLKQMKEAAASKPFLRHGLLSFDEVYVNPQADINNKSLLVFGYADNKPGKLAKTVLVFQYVALFSKRRFSVNVAWYGCVGLNSATLEKWLYDVMLALHHYGFFVHALVCDGAGSNRKLQKQLVAFAREAGADECSSVAIQHPLSPDPAARLFILSDPSHAIKKLRNCMYGRPMLYVDSEGERHEVRWEDFEQVRKWQLEQQRVDRPLTGRHISLTNYEKMSVRLAVDVMSDAIDKVLIEIYPDFYTKGTRAVMSFGRQLWSVMNSRKAISNMTSAELIKENLSALAEELRQWRNRTTAAERKDRKFLTNETYDDILRICDGVPGLIDYIFTVLAPELPRATFIPKIVSQDPLEKAFGALRQRGGGTQHITVKSIAYNLRTMNVCLLSRFGRSRRV